MAKKKKAIHPLPVSVAKKLAELDGISQRQWDLALRYMTSYGGVVGTSDLLVNGAINRSYHLIQGFSEMIRQGNYMCAIPLIRLQMDSVMRIYALWLVESPDMAAKLVLEGERLDNIKDRDGNALKDGYLHKKISEERGDSRFSETYRTTSAYVHLSREHARSQFDSYEEKNGALHLKIRIGPPSLDKWSERSMLDVIGGFISITELLHHYCEQWSKTRMSMYKESLENPAKDDEQAT